MGKGVVAHFMGRSSTGVAHCLGVPRSHAAGRSPPQMGPGISCPACAVPWVESHSGGSSGMHVAVAPMSRHGGTSGVISLDRVEAAPRTTSAPWCPLGPPSSES